MRRVSEVANTEADTSELSKATCAYDVEFAKSLLSTSDDIWRMNRRFLQHHEDSAPVSVGFEALANSLDYIYRVSECPHSGQPHSDHEARSDSYTAHSSLVATKGFYFDKNENKGPRVYVAQTYGNPRARWLALAGARDSEPHRLIVLRKESVCLNCFITQACQHDDEGQGLYLIL